MPDLMIDLLAYGFYIAAEQDLDDHGYRDNDQGYGVIFRCLGMNDLFHRLHKGGDAGIQHDHRNDHGA